VHQQGETFTICGVFTERVRRRRLTRRVNDDTLQTLIRVGPSLLTMGFRSARQHGLHMQNLDNKLNNLHLETNSIL
jgi:hypothetical protein